MSSTRFPGSRPVRFGWIAVVASLGWVAGASAQTSPAKEGDLLEQAKRLSQISAQKTELDVRRTLRDAQKLAQTDAAKAVEHLQATLKTVEQDTALTASRREALIRMLKDRIRVTQTEGENPAATALNERQAQDAIRRAGEERKTRDDEATRKGVQEVNELRKQGRTDEALRRANELSKEQPRNPAVEASKRSASAHEQIGETRRQVQEGERRRVVTMRNVERSGMPPAGDIEFPKDWAERTKNRKSTIQLTAKERSILQSLSSPVSVNFKGSRFEDVIEYLQTLTGQTILLDKASLDEMQVSYDSPISANVKNVTVRTLLRKILADLNLTYVVRDETIQVTSANRARELMVVRSYYVADIVSGVGWFDAVQILRNINSIIDMIQTSVDPQSWQTNGGAGTITFNPGTMSLVIKQSAEVHALLGNGTLR